MTTCSKTANVYDEFLDSSKFPNRPGQREAVRLLIELSDGGVVEPYAIQAPTGTGKSFAALLAGVHNARNNRRTVIGTSTVVLSDQYQKDISSISKHFPGIKFCVLKGSSNYFCGNKAGIELAKTPDVRKKNEKMRELQLFRKGAIDKLPIWAQSDTEFCSDCIKKMREGDGKTDCEYAKARDRALMSDVVVTTHAMINVDVRIKSASVGAGSSTNSAILGRVWLTVFDEAHKASESLVYNESFGLAQLRTLIHRGGLGSMLNAKRDGLLKHFETVNVNEWYNPSPAVALEALKYWPTSAELADGMKVVDGLDEVSRRKQKSAIRFLHKAQRILTEISHGVTNGGEAMWAAEMRHRDSASSRVYKIKDMIPDPILLKGMTQMRTAWMSATIGTETHPEYSLRKCGISSTRFESLESPFDYARQLKWTVRTDAQVSDQGAFVNAINSHWPGGCAVLTPNHRRKEKIAMSVRMQPNSPMVLEQSGTNSASVNAAAVAAHITAAEAGGSPVLVGVEIFSTGIDLPGNQLTKLIIAGMFPLRDDYPYTAWRGRWIEGVGGDAFSDYILPERAIVLEQQIGRIVRRETDSGVCVFYINDKDWRFGSQGERIIREALRRFPGAVQI